MKVLIIPDVHGRTFWRKALYSIDDYDKVIFLGDYLDPYPEEKITVLQAETEFKDIIEFKKNYPEKVTLLLGNHDMHYIYSTFPESTRMNSYNWVATHRMYKENIELFEVFKYIGTDDVTLVFSHAGVHLDWLKHNALSIDKLPKLTLDKLSPILGQISGYRGGINKTGSPVWADIREAFDGGMYIKGYFQIFGHTRAKEPIDVTGGIMLDTRNMWELDTKTMDTKKC